MITRRHVFREFGPSRSLQRFDPTSVDSVTTRQKGSNSSIETLTSISNPDQGVYKVDLDEDLYQMGVVYKLDWKYTVSGVQFTATDTWRKNKFGQVREREAWQRLFLNSITEYVACSEFLQDISDVLAGEYFGVKEVVNQDLYDSRHVQEAQDDALDGWAEENGLQREQGESDGRLRQRVLVQLGLFRAQGTIDDIQNLVIDAAKAQGETWDKSIFQIEEQFAQGETAYFYIEMDQSDLRNVGRDFIEDVIEDAKPAGVSYQLRSNGTFALTDYNKSPGSYTSIEGLTKLDSNGNIVERGGRLSGLNPR